MSPAIADLPRVMFLGSLGEFSRAPLAALLDHGFPVSAVVVARSGPSDPDQDAVRPVEPTRAPISALTLLEAPGAPKIVHLAWERGIPVLEIGRLRDPDCLAGLEPYRPDVLCVACFSRILPESILEWPRLGCLNLHPSLLPAYRGPAPLFWMFWNGEERAGVTIHIMDTGIDSGDILLQEAFAVPEGASGAELERECVQRGARLMAEAVCRLASGTLPRTPQPAGGSYHSWPAPRDFEAPVSRPARWVFNFIRGVGAWGPVAVRAGDRCFRTRWAAGYSATGMLGSPYERSEGGWKIQFSPGVVEIVDGEARP